MVSAPSKQSSSEQPAQPDALQCFVRNAMEAMLIVAADGRILQGNDVACDLFGYAHDALAGLDLQDVVSVTDGGKNRPLPLDSTSDSFDVSVRSKSGSRKSLHADRVRLGSASTSEQVWSFRASADGKSEARLNAAQRIAKIANWELDVPTETHWWSDEMYRMLEIDPNGDGNFYEQFIDRIHPEDRESFLERADRAMRTGVAEVLEVRIVMPDGREWLAQSQGDIELDEAGKPVKMSGTLQDISERKRAELALKLSEARYKVAQRLAKLGNWEWNIERDEHWWSDELYSILEVDPDKIAPSLENFLTRVCRDDRKRILENVRTVDEECERSPSEVRLRFEDGRRKTIEINVEVRFDGDGRAVSVAGTVRDVTERRELEAKLLDSEDRYASTVELAPLGIAHVDGDGRFVWVNRHLCELLGYSKDELLSLTIKQVSHPDDTSISDEPRARLHSGDLDTVKIEKRYLHKSGATVWVRITSSVRRDAEGVLLYDIAAVEDISDRKAAEARVQYLATHDEMTGLPNRSLFNELAHQAIARSRRLEKTCAILFLDLDRFKIVNDSLGHQAGDLLLKLMAARMRQCLRESDVLARLGGDEFVVLLQDLPERNDAASVARKILGESQKPVELVGQECRVTASIGIASYPDDANDVSTLMKYADMAMYLAKDEGKNNFQFYSAETVSQTAEHLLIESQLNHALDRKEFAVQYQPRVSLRTGRIMGAEALIRWWNHDLGTVSPAQFIPLAEDTGLVVPIGRWVLQAACRQGVAWQEAGLRPLAVSVNLSPRQFRDAALLDDIRQALDESGFAPELLELEITESMIIGDVDRAVRRAEEIKELGVRLAIDDFGAGYSSLGQLGRFPIDTLKVDRSFIRDVVANGDDRAIAEAIISLGKKLGVTVVAEGVETAAQLAFLRDHGCDEMQGFYFSRPCDADRLAELLMMEVRQESA